MNLADFFSLERTLAYIQSVFDIGEKAAGTQKELKAAKLIESELRDFGLENVHCEPFTVVSRNYKDCQLKILEPSAETVPCVTGGTCMSTPPQGIRADLIDAGFGTVRDFERLKKKRIDPEGKIALIERSDRLTYWADFPRRLAKDYGIEAIIFTLFSSEHTAFRKDAFPFALLPVVNVPYKIAQSLRAKIRKQNVKVELKNIIETKEDGVSYNVMGELVGSKYPEEIITLTAHHDSLADWDYCGGDCIRCNSVFLWLALRYMVGPFGDNHWRTHDSRRNYYHLKDSEVISLHERNAMSVRARRYYQEN